jgi:hypothetical protein
MGISVEKQPSCGEMIQEVNWKLLSVKLEVRCLIEEKEEETENAMSDDGRNPNVLLYLYSALRTFSQPGHPMSTVLLCD